MPRTRDQENYDKVRHELLAIGELLFRKSSYSEIGINDILQAAEIPKGSFYHYFSNKEAFLIDVANYYHANQMADAKKWLRDDSVPAFTRLRNFFDHASGEMRKRHYAEGCLMCNLTTELADENIKMQKILDQHWTELSSEIARCLADQSLEKTGLAHLSTKEAADFLLNSWSGALTRMKASVNDAPLTLFIKSALPQEDNSHA